LAIEVFRLFSLSGTTIGQESIAIDLPEMTPAWINACTIIPAIK